jgi:hypothetical protein
MKEGDQRNFHAHSLRAKLMGMLDGLEAEVALVVDVMLPTERLVDGQLVVDLGIAILRAKPEALQKRATRAGLA